jgi:hypothetical protein
MITTRTATRPVTPAGLPLADFRYAGMFYPGNGAAEGGLHLTQYRG